MSQQFITGSVQYFTLNKLVMLILSTTIIIINIITAGLKVTRIKIIYFSVFTFIISMIVISRGYVGVPTTTMIAYIAAYAIYVSYKNGYHSHRIIVTIVYAFVVLILYNIIVLVKPPDEILAGSRNALSLQVLLGAFLLYFSMVFKGLNGVGSHVLNIVLIFLSLLISLYAGGRSGLISLSVLFLLYTYWFSFHYKGSGGSRKVLPYFLVFILLLLVFLIVPESEKSEYLRIRGLEDRIRYYMIMEYIGQMTELDNLLLGIKIQNLQSGILLKLDHNIHNSYLMLHSQFGVLAIMLLLFMVRICFSIDFLFSLITFVIFLRFSTDNLSGSHFIMLFPGLLFFGLEIKRRQVLSSKIEKSKKRYNQLASGLISREN